MVATNARSFFGRSKSVRPLALALGPAIILQYLPLEYDECVYADAPWVSSIRHRVQCPRSDSGNQTSSRYEDQRSVRTRSEQYQPGMLLQEFPSTLPRYSAESENDERAASRA